MVAVLASSSGCEQRSSPGGESPAANTAQARPDEQGAAATVAAMLALAEEGAWGAYVDDFYGESHKFASDEDRNQLVQRFEQQWGTQVVEALRQATTIAPVIDDDGRAVFTTDGEPVFVLYRTDDGRWTFHL
jgi:hypothetical protein